MAVETTNFSENQILNRVYDNASNAIRVTGSGLSSGGGGGGTGDASAANQVTQITAANTSNTKLDTLLTQTDGIEASLTSIDNKNPALGQALAGASVPVVLPATQIASLTSPAAITGYATASGQAIQIIELTNIDTKLPASLTASGNLRVAIIENISNTNPSTGALQVSGNASLYSIDAKTPTLGTAGTPSNNVTTVQGITAGTPLPTLEQSRVASNSDVHLPASGTAAIVTYTAASGTAHVIGGVAWSYNGIPTAGNLKIEDVSGTIVFSIDITAAGPGFIPFARPKKSAATNTAMIITLASGGAAVTGKVSVLSHWTE